MHLPRNRLTVIGGVAVLLVVAVVALIFARGQTGSGPVSSPAQSHAAQSPPAQNPQAQAAAPAGFAWFRPRFASPGSWLQASLAGRSGVLSYPGMLRPMHGDPGTVTFGLNTRAGAVLVYLNVTPRQGDETLQNWPRFRVGHLAEEGQRAVRVDATSAMLPFQGGQGRCVVDDYTSRVHNNRYREIACLVRGAHASSVVIATTRVATWAQYGTLLEQVVNGYAVK
jgi:hypothetical protein